MGRPWVPVPLASVPKELRKFVDGLNEWARDKDRLEASLGKPIDTPSASSSLALNKEFAVDSTRIGNTSRRTLNPLDVVGSLVPSDDAVFDIGQPTGPPKRWRDGWFSRNLDANGNLDVQGNVVTGGNLTAGGTITFGGNIANGITVSGDIVPSLNNTYQLGDFSLGDRWWNNIWGNTIYCQNLVAGYDHTGVGPTGVGGLVVVFGGFQCLTGATIAEAVSTDRLLTAFYSWIGTTFGCGGSATIGSGLGVSGFIDVAGGLSTPGGITVGGVVRLGSTMTVGTVNIDPVTTNTGALGRAARRWGNIFGSTVNCTALTTSGLTCTSEANFTSNVNVSGGLTISGSVNFGGGIGAEFIPSVDNTYDLGGPSVRWQELSLAGTAYLSKGADLTSGTTVSLTADGNYFDVTGTATIGGLSTPVIVNGNTKFLPGTPIILQFDAAAKMQNGTHQSLLAGVTFAAAAGDHIGLIVDSINSAGRPNFREYFRWRADGIRRQSTATNKSMGRATLIAGITTVANTSVTANSNIFLTVQTIGGFMGVLGITNVSAGASFGISSSSNADTSTIAWEIVEPEGV